MMKKEIQFKEADLIGSLQEALAHAQGKLTLKTTKVPARTRSISAAEWVSQSAGRSAPAICPRWRGCPAAAAGPTPAGDI